jgi:hypothetical protein
MRENEIIYIIKELNNILVYTSTVNPIPDNIKTLVYDKLNKYLIML